MPGLNELLIKNQNTFLKCFPITVSCDGHEVPLHIIWQLSARWINWELQVFNKCTQVSLLRAIFQNNV